VATTFSGHGPRDLLQDNMRKLRTVILASGSPRRKAILRMTGLKFRVDESDYEELPVPGLKPNELAKFHARQKARDVARRHRNAIVIAADTIVVLQGSLYGKPWDRAQAGEMLKALSGKAHSVITGFTIIDTADSRELSGSVETKVFFKKLSTDEIKAYVRSGEPLDKAGAYGIQGLGSILVNKIEGDFFNVVGLPLHALAEGLKKFGIFVL
jgi:septum formation protein